MPASPPSRAVRWSAFFAVILALALGFASSSMPTPLYPLYQLAWSLPPSALSYIYAGYMFGVLGALLFCGRLADSIGRFRVLLAALCLLLLGLGISALVSSVLPMVFARMIVGFANGLLTTIAGATMLAAHPRGDRRVAAVATSTAMASGFGLGPLIGGSIAELMPQPLRLPYLAMGMIALVDLALLLYARRVLDDRTVNTQRAAFKLRPKLTLPHEPGPRRLFLLMSSCIFMMFAIVGLMASLLPSLIHQLGLGSGPSVVGIAFSLLALASVCAQFGMRRLRATHGLLIGLAALLASMAALVACLFYHSPSAFFASMLLAGIGQGLSLMETNLIASHCAEEHHRTTTMASYFTIAYLGGVAPVVAIGLLADYLGLEHAVQLFCLLCALVIVFLALRISRSKRAREI